MRTFWKFEFSSNRKFFDHVSVNTVLHKTFMYKVHLAQTVAQNNTALYEDNTEPAGNPAHGDSVEVV